MHLQVLAFINHQYAHFAHLQTQKEKNTTFDITARTAETGVKVIKL